MAGGEVRAAAAVVQLGPALRANFAARARACETPPSLGHARGLRHSLTRADGDTPGRWHTSTIPRARVTSAQFRYSLDMPRVHWRPIFDLSDHECGSACRPCLPVHGRGSGDRWWLGGEGGMSRAILPAQRHGQLDKRRLHSDFFTWSLKEMV